MLVYNYFDLEVNVAWHVKPVQIVSQYSHSNSLVRRHFAERDYAIGHRELAAVTWLVWCQRRRATENAELRRRLLAFLANGRASATGRQRHTKRKVKTNKKNTQSKIKPTDFPSATLRSQRLAMKGAHNHKEGPNPEKTVVEQTLKNNNCGRLPWDRPLIHHEPSPSACNQCVSAQRRGCLHVQWAHVVQFILVCQPHCASGPQHWPYLFNQPSQSVTLRSYRRSGLTMLKCPEKKRQKCYHVTVWGLAHYAESG